MLFFLLFVICVFAQDHTIWMGSLDLHLLSDGGSFTMKGYTDRETWVPLPGEHGTWPYSVRDQEQNLLVIDRDGIPHALLEKGTHQITGIFSWSDIPAHIKTPPNIGIIAAKSDNKTIPVYRSPKRIWFSPDHIPVQTYNIRQSQHDEHIEYTIYGQGIEQPVDIPIPLSDEQKLLAIETSMPYWYQKNMLHMLLPEGVHSVKLLLEETISSPPASQKSLTLHRMVKADATSVVITDIWNGHRAENTLLYANSTNHIPKGSQSISITHTQPNDSVIAPLLTQQNIKDYTVRMQHPGHIRVFEQWPFASIALWILCALMLWRDERFQRRRLLLLCALLCVVISPIALVFCIGWIALKDSLPSSSEESLQIRTLAMFVFFAGIIMLSISPSAVHTIELHHITPELYWINDTTIFVLAAVSIAIFAFVAYKNISYSILIAILVGLYPQNSRAESGFPLCSIQLEGESIIISGEVHQSQEGDWKAPGPIGSIQVQKIFVDGTEFYSFRTTSENHLSLFLPKGISEFEIHGTYNSPFGLQFPQKPARLDFFSSTHQIEGLHEDHSTQKTLFFWNDVSPDIIVRKPTLTMQVQIDEAQTSVQSTVTNHSGTKTYDLPTWSDHVREFATTSKQQVFPSRDSQVWTDSFPTPSKLSFAPSSDQYDIKTFIHCSEDILCTHKDVIWNHSDTLLPNQSIDIHPVSNHTQKTRILTSSHPTSSFRFWSPSKESSSTYLIDHNPHTVFFRVHLPFLGLSLLICFFCAFILAKHARSPLNIMEWLWILLGAGFVHPLAIPFCILSFLAIHNIWMKYLCLLALGCVSYTSPFGISSWKSSEQVAAVDQSLLYQGLGIWLLGVFFFVHSFKLSQQPVEIGGSQTG